MSTNIRLNGAVVSRSRNLRGVLDYARKHPVERVQIAPLAGQGLLFVQYMNGATCNTTFQSFSVLRDWVKARRSWPTATVTTSLNIGV